jgi:hypothetical protein
MATWIVCAAFVVTAFGYSPAPVLTIGALVLTFMAYIIAKRRALMRMGVIFALFAAGHYYAMSVFGQIMQSGSSPELKVLRVMASDELLLTVASMVMLISVMIGVYGPDQKAEFKKFLREHQNDDAGHGN